MARENSRQGDISNFDILIRPFVEELDATNLLRYLFGQDHVPTRIVDLDFGGVRHAGQTQGVLCEIVVCVVLACRIRYTLFHCWCGR